MWIYVNYGEMEYLVVTLRKRSWAASFLKRGHKLLHCISRRDPVFGYAPSFKTAFGSHLAQVFRIIAELAAGILERDEITRIEKNFLSRHGSQFTDFISFSAAKIASQYTPEYAWLEC